MRDSAGTHRCRRAVGHQRRHEQLRPADPNDPAQGDASRRRRGRAACPAGGSPPWTLRTPNVGRALLHAGRFHKTGPDTPGARPAVPTAGPRVRVRRAAGARRLRGRPQPPSTGGILRTLADDPLARPVAEHAGDLPGRERRGPADRSRPAGVRDGTDRFPRFRLHRSRTVPGNPVVLRRPRSCRAARRTRLRSDRRRDRLRRPFHADRRLSDRRRPIRHRRGRRSRRQRRCPPGLRHLRFENPAVPVRRPTGDLQPRKAAQHHHARRNALSHVHPKPTPGQLPVEAPEQAHRTGIPRIPR